MCWWWRREAEHKTLAVSTSIFINFYARFPSPASVTKRLKIMNEWPPYEDLSSYQYLQHEVFHTSNCHETIYFRRAVNLGQRKI
jgi:hypothetical protein